MGWPEHPIPVAPVINLSGPATIWGTSQSSIAVCEAVAHALAHHWDMAAVARWAGETIARWSGAEAGALTNCAAAGITLTVAACMTGADPGRIAQLPDATGMQREVVISRGHVVDYGASIAQMIRLAGATVREFGTVNRTPESDLTHEDMQIQRIVASGADLVVVSGQKYLSGPTAGIVCGRADLVAAVEAQVGGIGRTMKVGKDGYFGTIVALEQRMSIDLASWAQVQKARADRLAAGLQGLRGATVTVRKDRVGQPIHRVEVVIDPAVAGTDAAGVCAALRKCTPSIKPRAYQVDEGWFALEPVHITEDELAYVVRELRWILGASDPTLPPATAPHS